MTTRGSHRFVSLLAAGVTAAALAAPAAVARPIDGPNDPVRPAAIVAAESEPVPPRAPLVQEIDDGFDWGSAAIGAGATGALVILVSLGGFAHATRDRVQATP